MVADDVHRVYQMRWTRLSVRACYPAWLLLSGILAAGSHHDHGSVSLFVWVFCPIVLVALLLWCERIAVKSGLVEQEDGLLNLHPYGRRLVRWTDLDRFDHRKRGTKDRVYAVEGGGRWIPLIGIEEGPRVIWDGGESRDIVGVLNARLEARRAAGTARGA
jgi:hypothetical protein